MSLLSQQWSCESCVDIRSHFSVFFYRAGAIELKVTKVKIDFTIEFLKKVLSKISYFYTFGAPLSDFWHYVAKIGELTKM